MKYLFALLALCFTLLSCTKDSFITSTDARLSTSVDSLKFDTVFTSIGTVTKSFKIINKNDQKLLISSIQLAGGTTSPFKINVNGQATAAVANISIAANDSIYVFVTAKVNPTLANLPFIISDSILIQYNGNTRKVNIEAYGKNGIFIRNGLVVGNVTFNNTLPYIILGALRVMSGGTLTIPAGTSIYCHADAPLIIDGTLICNGTKTQPIIFTGDRLDEPYRGYPASWPGIFFRATSKNNFLQFTYINNSYQGLTVNAVPVNNNPSLIVRQCIIDNALEVGLLCNNTKVEADNCLISNCGSGIDIRYGGHYTFTHCTIVGYSNNYVLHKKPSLFITDANETNQTNPTTLLVKNSIIYGDAGFVPNEIQTTKLGNSFTSNVANSLYRAATADPANTTLSANIKNIDPAFDSIDNNRRIYNFRTTKNATAPGINKGAATTFTNDLDDKNRNVAIPDMGAYEKP